MIYIVCLIVASGVLSLDLLTKYLAVKNQFNVVVIPNLLKFKLSYNTGAAFSFLGDKPWAKYLFSAFTIIVCLGILAYFIYAIIKKKSVSKWLSVALSLVFGGAIGNLIDRLWLGKVRDFLFLFYNTDIFPAIFNIADVALVVGVIMISVFIMFMCDDALFKPSKSNIKQQPDAENESETTNNASKINGAN